MSVQILTGDVRAMLATLPKESVHCVVTSPPYWGLRCYGVEGQIGQEPTLGEHVEVMVEVFREVRRVLRKDGTVWLNYGDCYATSANGRSTADTKAAGKDDRTFRDKPFSTVGPVYDPNYRKRTTGGIHAERRPDSGGRVVAGGVLKPKDLCMMPARVALALQADGWWLRSEIIWHKPNPMPESIGDRPTSSHEKIYLLARSERYFFDAEAVREPQSTKLGGEFSQVFGGRNKFEGYGNPTYSGKQWEPNPSDRNIRNVWTIATAPFPSAHFATFPPALVEPCIKAGTSEKGCCPECSAPWVRDVDKASGGGIGKSWHDHSNDEQTGQSKAILPEGYSPPKTIGWRLSCGCKPVLDGGSPQSCTVLDPFAGAGTVGLVADRLKRDAILIELNPDYAAMARARIQADAGMFAEVSNT